MSLKAVLFDFDGTLADTLPLSFFAFQQVFKKYEHREVSREEIISMFGPTEEGIIVQNFTNQSNVESAIYEYYEIYKQGHLDLKHSSEEIHQLLSLLKAKGLFIGVITGKSRKAFNISVGSLTMSQFFDVSITGDDVRKAKPDPEGIEIALSVLAVSKDEAVFLGDSNADIMAGKSAGLRTFGVQWLSTFQSDHFDTKPDRIFTTVDGFIEEIPNL